MRVERPFHPPPDKKVITSNATPRLGLSFYETIYPIGIKPKTFLASVIINDGIITETSDRRSRPKGIFT